MNNGIEGLYTSFSKIIDNLTKKIIDQINNKPFKTEIKQITNEIIISPVYGQPNKTKFNKQFKGVVPNIRWTGNDIFKSSIQSRVLRLKRKRADRFSVKSKSMLHKSSEFTGETNPASIERALNLINGNIIQLIN